MNRARVAYDDIGVSIDDVQEALASMFAKHEVPGFVESAQDDRLLWTFDDDAVTFYWRETGLPKDEAAE